MTQLGHLLDQRLRRVADYSPFMLAALMIGHHFSISAF
jgi:hypothetical protein